ncbi:tRNA (guanosine(46)-N7)-methyltransferase TrmB [uncultured Desulfuromonas sp.]|uniref:tRNA (guanosine(46)-N7)-methyltransferase TrmB n=1 Tax=uncultured Desulfuromonas sp. TaxID=181013 RepID=UPI002AAAAB46|nr:tRNA (guanosine(46)-N7)-methyltransferase TrmB [uncultured Desulfuromonas sp.]
MTQRQIEITSPTFIDAWKLPADQDIHQLFDQQQPLALEIGCGTGDFIVQRAAQQPDTNFLAIDIYNKGCYKSCRRIDKTDLANIRVMRMEARYLLSRFGRADMLSAIYINCPDPWPKKRHRDRRLVNTTLLTQMLYYLQPGGDLYFVTDVADYAEQVAELIPALPGYQNQLDTPFTLELEGYPLSKYMRRFLSQNLPVHFQHLKRREDFILPKEQLPVTEKGFRNRHNLDTPCHTI